MSHTWEPNVIKENLGIGEQPRDEDMTMDADGKNEHSRSNMTNALAMSSPKPMRDNMKRSRTGRT